MTRIILNNKGVVDKYIGDAIVAFWGAPIAIGDHVNKAVDGAVKMLEALPAINDEFKSQGLPEFKIGLGLNSGECSVGNMGSDTIFAYTALGDNMNLGARLESLCKYYGAQILVSEYTYKKMDKERFKARKIDNAVVKGKEEPVGVYEVLYSYHPFMIDENAYNNFIKAFELFIDKDFAGALKLFDDILSDHPEDKSSLRIKERCEHFIQNPPEANEHIITTMTTK
jgi:adenylate cyclase